jgi:hypothetical protein
MFDDNSERLIHRGVPFQEPFTSPLTFICEHVGVCDRLVETNQQVTGGNHEPGLFDHFPSHRGLRRLARPAQPSGETRSAPITAFAVEYLRDSGTRPAADGRHFRADFTGPWILGRQSLLDSIHGIRRSELVPARPDQLVSGDGNAAESRGCTSSNRAAFFQMEQRLRYYPDDGRVLLNFGRVSHEDMYLNVRG